MKKFNVALENLSNGVGTALDKDSVTQAASTFENYEGNLLADYYFVLS